MLDLLLKLVADLEIDLKSEQKISESKKTYASFDNDKLEEILK